MVSGGDACTASAAAGVAEAAPHHDPLNPESHPVRRWDSGFGLSGLGRWAKSGTPAARRHVGDHGGARYPAGGRSRSAVIELKGCNHVDAVRIGLEVLLILSGLFLTMLILMHKGKGGGISDMFGGGMSTSMSSSSVAERNLTRITILVALVWVTAIVGIGLIDRFNV